MEPPVKLLIDLHHQATLPLDPQVLEAMTPNFTEFFSHAASKIHAFGREARHAVEAAREMIGRSIQTQPQTFALPRAPPSR
jgi:cysteine desulfurase